MAPATAKESDVQSSLFRLSIMLATALDTMHSDPPAVQMELSKIPSPEKIREDFLGLLILVKKAVTQYTLAVRPETKKGKGSSASGETSTSGASDPDSPLAGLAPTSYAAAKQQIDALTNDLLPKLMYLVQKARVEADIYAPRKDAESEENKHDKKSLDEVERLAKQMGGVVMTADQLGLPSNAKGKGKETGPRIGGHGGAWAKELSRTVLILSNDLVKLVEASIDERTRKTMEKAAEARARNSGASLQRSGDRPSRTSKAEQRDQLLRAAANIWETCDEAPATIALNAAELLLKRIKMQRDLMKDAVEELNSLIKASEGQNSSAKKTKSSGIDSSDEERLPAEHIHLAKKVLPLLRIGDMFVARLFDLFSQSRFKAELLEKVKIEALMQPLEVMSAEFDVAADELFPDDGDLDFGDDDEDEDDDGEDGADEGAEGVDAEGDEGSQDAEDEEESWGLQKALERYVESAQEVYRLAQGKPSSETWVGAQKVRGSSPLNDHAELSKEYLDGVKVLHKFPEEMERLLGTMMKEGIF